MCARKFLLSTALLAIAACGEGRHSDQQEVLLVSAAVSLSDALSVVAAEYERASGISVVLNLAGSDTLATQLAAGAPADVFVSADRRQMDRIENAGLNRSRHACRSSGESAGGDRSVDSCPASYRG